jgi:D-alanyl-D-alanine dipeptidase
LAIDESLQIFDQYQPTPAQLKALDFSPRQNFVEHGSSDPNQSRTIVNAY